MNLNEYITFFPGKGIYLLPSGREIVSVYTAEDARAVFSAYSYFHSYGNFPQNCPPEIQDKARQLRDFYTNFLPSVEMFSTPIHTIPDLAFSDINSSGTRNSIREIPVNWENIKALFERAGYILKKRVFLNNEFNTICPVYYLEHPELGVLSEGKGLTDQQAQRSALAEGVERLVARTPTSNVKNTFISSTYNQLSFTNSFDLGYLTGPRDSFSKESLTEWIPAKNVRTNQNAFLPVELAYYNYVPASIRTRFFSLHHTMGLAAGSSIEDATVSGIFEILERDAYWITMRCRINCPDIDLNEIPDLDPKIHKIIELLEKTGFKLSLKDMSLDWGIAIAHAVITDKYGRIPAYSHGTGASFKWSVAVARAVCEVLQVYSGLDALTNGNFAWEEVVSADGVLGNPTLAWSDPLFTPHIQHLITPSRVKWSPEIRIGSIGELLSHLHLRGHEVFVADLQSELDLKVVRVHITNVTPPDNRLEKISKRLEKWRTKLKIQRGFYTDPILT